MCGIAGSLGALNTNHVPLVDLMLHSLRHRGPDGKGIVELSEERCEYFRSTDSDANLLSSIPIFNARVVLGQVRLAIIDLSEDGLQPMQSENGGNWLVFNGEIYNYIELRQDLGKLGHNFHTESDTEVILAAYCEWGRNMLERLEGMFALALFDTERQRLFCARDRFGEKPFFYSLQDNTFRFASEIKALLAVGVSRRPNLGSIANYLASGQSYFNEQTFFADIHQLPAGHFLEFGLDDGLVGLKPQPYYFLPVNSDDGHLTLAEYEAEFLRKLRRSVNLRLRADVPVGTCLSGGLDSSAVAALCLEQLAPGTPLFNAFNAVPDEPRFSELEWAKLVVKGKRAVLHEVNVAGHEILADIDELVRAQDEPFPTLSMYLQYRVMRSARNSGIPVLMDGQGGDETLLGYERMYGTYLAELIGKGQFRKAISEFRAFVRNSQVGTLTLLAVMIYSRKGVSALWRSNRQVRWLSDELSRLVVNETPPEALDERQRYEMRVIPLPSLLRYEDRNAMHFAIETRLPFLDHKLVEFCLQAPPHAKLNNGWTKWMLRAGLQNVLPPQIAWRKDKKGFSAPDSIWLQSLQDEACNILSDRPRSQAFYKDQSPWQLFQANLTRNHHFAWRIFCLEKWMRIQSVDN